MRPSDRSARLIVASSMVAGVLTTATAPGASAAPNVPSRATFASCEAGWNEVVTPVHSSYDNYAGVAAISSRDIWAVGNGIGRNGSRFVTLTGHWDGTSWTRVSSPTLEHGSELSAVAAVASDDVWAVGRYFHPVGRAIQVRSLTEHWDGRSWTVVASPSPGEVFTYLFGVYAVASDDVWAVGFRDDGFVHHTLTLHWNGAAWKVVPSVDPDPEGNFLNAVSGTGADDVWAVGEHGQDPHHTLTEHWDGTRWSVVPAPDGGTKDNWLLGVAASSRSLAWAVGYVGPEGQSAQSPLVERWDGSTWSVVDTPKVGTARFAAVAAPLTTGATVVGSTIDPNTDGTHTLVERWDGSGWSVEASPSPEDFRNELQAVVKPAGARPWAVGFAESHVGLARPLALRRCRA